MKEFKFKSPTQIKFGVDAAKNISEILYDMNKHKVFIVTDKTIEQTLPFIDLVGKLKEDGFSCTIFSETQPDPPIEVVDEAAGILKESECDIVISVGGGSVIDTAKSMCMLATNEGSIKDYLFGGTKTVKSYTLPLIAVPTTAGSGSEVTAASVISDNERNIKLSVTHEYLTPKYAIVDPIMQKGMPQIITASTGMDALTHAIEAFVSLNAQPISDAYAMMAIKLIGENIRIATFEPDNIEARGNMAIASIMAATAFANAGLGAVHGISQAMGGIAHTPHGIANALLLPYVMEMNLSGNIKKFATIAALLGDNIKDLSDRNAAQRSVSIVEQLSLDIRIPTKLREVNVSKDMFDTIVEGTMDYRLLKLNPVNVREMDVYEILNKAY